LAGVDQLIVSTAACLDLVAMNPEVTGPYPSSNLPRQLHHFSIHQICKVVVVVVVVVCHSARSHGIGSSSSSSQKRQPENERPHN
jgi:hypothetical protein